MPEADNHGIRLSYDVCGSGRPLILLHGWSCDRGWWDHTGFVGELAEDHRIVNVDLRGHGRSSCPHDPASYSADEVVGDVLAVAAAEGLDRFSIWGLSYGGQIGWLTAAAHSDRVAALVTSGAWDPRPDSFEEDQDAWESWPDLIELRSRGTAGMVALRRENKELYLDMPDWLEASFLAADPQALLAVLHPSLWERALPTFEGYTVPTVLISGSLEDPDNDGAAIAATIPHGESLWLRGLNHGGSCAGSALSVPTRERSSIDGTHNPPDLKGTRQRSTFHAADMVHSHVEPAPAVTPLWLPTRSTHKVRRRRRIQEA